MLPFTLIRRLARTGAIALAVATLLLGAADAPRPVHAAGIVVNTLVDANPPATEGLCSLREAITNANDNAATFDDCPAGAGADTITFSVSGTIVMPAIFPSWSLTVSDPAGLLLDSSRQQIVLDLAHQGTALTVEAGASAVLRHMTVVNASNGNGVLNNAGVASLAAVGEAVGERLSGLRLPSGAGLFSLAGRLE